MVSISSAFQHLSNPRCYVPLCSTLIPIALQMCYRWARHNKYKGMSTVDHYADDSPQRKQRNDQHRLFLILAGGEVITFLALSRFNRYYLIPTGYTVVHLLWTHWSKINETIEVSGATPSFWSMDGKRPIGN